MKKKKHKNVPSSLAACILAFCACAAAFAAASAPDPSLGAGGESSFFPATWKTSQTASMASVWFSKIPTILPVPRWTRMARQSDPPVSATVLSWFTATVSSPP